MKRLFSFLLMIFLLSNSAFADIQVLFSPKGGCQDSIVAQIDKAQKTIDIAMYYLTSREIAQGLVMAKDRGVQIRILLDKSQETQKYSKSRYLIKRGFAVKYHTGYGLMHNKYAVIDNAVLIAGSFNWTPTADQQNEENLLIITDPGTVKKFAERFEYLWQNGRIGEVKAGQADEETGAVSAQAASTSTARESTVYVGSVKTKKYHLASCVWAQRIKDKNKAEFASIREAKAAGYVPCKVCNREASEE
jgi:phosphatidylserine/phosphatidylglycerophosphate/cardiolipin synthase-like enzyme